MSEKKKEEEIGQWPLFPPLDEIDWAWKDCNLEKSKAKFEGFNAGMKSFWEKSIDMQKSSLDGSKDQYDQFFDYIQDMMDSFAESLPEELPWMPAWIQPPKAFRKSMKEWEKMVNDHIKEQMDSWTDFFIKSQEKACEQIPDAPESAEEKDVVAEVKAK